MRQKRIQLTLFIDDSNAEVIEGVRRMFNPEQYALIKAHVTLCREDELEPLEQVLHNLKHLEHGYVTLRFGEPIRFSHGKGVLLPAIGNDAPFQELRKSILQGLVGTPGKQEPHITLMHPRNATCTDQIFEQIRKADLPEIITFRQISLIEQELGKPWKVLAEYLLRQQHLS